jgi:hypothetical protein
MCSLSWMSSRERDAVGRIRLERFGVDRKEGGAEQRKEVGAERTMTEFTGLEPLHEADDDGVGEAVPGWRNRR